MQIDENTLLHIPITSVSAFDVDSCNKLKEPSADDVRFKYSGSAKQLALIIELPYALKHKERITLYPDEFLTYFEIIVKEAPPIHLGSIPLYDDTPISALLREAIGFFAWEHSKGTGYTIYTQHANSILCTIVKFTKID